MKNWLRQFKRRADMETYICYSSLLPTYGFLHNNNASLHYFIFWNCGFPLCWNSKWSFDFCYGTSTYKPYGTSSEWLSFQILRYPKRQLHNNSFQTESKSFRGAKRNLLNSMPLHSVMVGYVDIENWFEYLLLTCHYSCHRCFFLFLLDFRLLFFFSSVL